MTRRLKITSCVAFAKVQTGPFPVLGGTSLCIKASGSRTCDVAVGRTRVLKIPILSFGCTATCRTVRDNMSNCVMSDSFGALTSGVR